MKKALPNPLRARVSRRGFMQSGAAAGLSSQLMLLSNRAKAAGNSLEGYASAASVAPGQEIDFFVRDPQAAGAATTACSLVFSRISFPDAFMGSTTFAVGAQVVPADASTKGCRWKSSYRLTVPAEWPSGLYFAFVGSGPTACTIPFIVRVAASAATAKTLVMIPVTTAHAYNTYGGKGIYDYGSTGGIRASQVSLDRPFTESFTTSFDIWSQSLARWIAKNAIAVDFCTDLDIEANPATLSPYQLVVISGHDEYWSSARRASMDAYLAGGGNVAYLGGNTAWFQARLEPGNGVNNRTLVCYKDAAADPVQDPALKTINYIALSTPRPENSTCGLGYVTGCSWVSSLPRPDTPSVVMRAEHWAFTGTGLAQGAGFGGAYVGYESNSASFVLGTDRRAYPTGTDGTPATLKILAAADGSNWNALSLAAGGAGEQSGYAHVAVFSRGGSAGTVFNAGSNDWCYGLNPEVNGQTPTAISRITLNVFNKLSKPWTESADVRQFSRPVSGSMMNTYYGIGTSAPANSGLALDGFVFRAFAVGTARSVPVYRFRSPTPGSTGTRYCHSRSSTPDSSISDWLLDGVAFHAFSAAQADSEPVYQHSFFNATSRERSFYLTTSPTAVAGWTAGPAVFCAPTDVVSSTTPSFRLLMPANNQVIAKPFSTSISETVKVMGVNGFNQTVSFTVTGAPRGVTVSLQPERSGTGTQLRVSMLPLLARRGSYALTVTGTFAATATVPACTSSINMILQVT